MHWWWGLGSAVVKVVKVTVQTSGNREFAAAHNNLLHGGRGQVCNRHQAWQWQVGAAACAVMNKCGPTVNGSPVVAHRQVNSGVRCVRASARG